MTVLTIAVSELRRLAGIDAADTSQDTILGAVQTAEQPALEWALDPTTLADNTSGVRALLTLGVSEQLAGSYLQQIARNPLPLSKLTLGPLVVTPPTPAELRGLGTDLVKAGTERLAPYTRAGIVAAANVAALAAAKLSAEQAAATIQQAAATDATALETAKLTLAQQDALAATSKATLAAAEAAAATADIPGGSVTNTAALTAAKVTIEQQNALAATAKATLATADAANATAAATAKLTIEQQNALTATAKATQAAAQATQATQAADTAAALDAAKLTIAQGQAAKYTPIDPATTSILQGPTSPSLFGTLNPLALDTDDSDPPTEFTQNYVAGSDSDEVDDPFSPFNLGWGEES